MQAPIATGGAAALQTAGQGVRPSAPAPPGRSQPALPVYLQVAPGILGLGGRGLEGPSLADVALGTQHSGHGPRLLPAPQARHQQERLAGRWRAGWRWDWREVGLEAGADQMAGAQGVRREQACHSPSFSIAHRCHSLHSRPPPQPSVGGGHLAGGKHPTASSLGAYTTPGQHLLGLCLLQWLQLVVQGVEGGHFLGGSA